MSRDPNQWMDRDDALAYIMRYPVVMLEETSGIPADGNFSEIYKNAITVGLRNNRNIKKGPDVKYDDIFTWHEANYGFVITGDALVRDRACLDGGKKFGSEECNKSRCADYVSKTYDNPEPDVFDNIKNFETLSPINDFAELATFWYNYQKNPQYIPLFIRVKLNGNNSAHIVSTGKYNNGSNFQFQVTLVLKNYVCLGDIVSPNEKLGSSVSVLYAHKSICALRNAYNQGELYSLVGQFQFCQYGSQLFRCTSNKQYKVNLPIYILRSALFKIATEQSIHRKISIDVANAVDGTVWNEYYTLLTNPKTILNDLVTGFMSQEGDYPNLRWKGINDDDGSSGNRFKFISTLCRLSYNVPAYPDLCACLGNGDEETELKKTNPKFSFFCYSQKCFQGDPGTYKFIPNPQPECPTIKMCDQRLEGNVFKFVKIDKRECNQTINTSNLSPAKGSAVAKRSYNAIFFTTIVVCVIFAIMVLIFINNKNTV